MVEEQRLILWPYSCNLRGRATVASAVSHSDYHNWVNVLDLLVLSAIHGVYVLIGSHFIRKRFIMALVMMLLPRTFTGQCDSAQQLWKSSSHHCRRWTQFEAIQLLGGLSPTCRLCKRSPRRT